MIQKNKRRSLQEWASLIQECRTSGLSDLEWCKQHSIPFSTFYKKIATLRQKACDIPKAQHHASYIAQEVVPLEIIEDIDRPAHSPAIVLNIQGYRIEIANHAAKETIINTLSVLQQLC